MVTPMRLIAPVLTIALAASVAATAPAHAAWKTYTYKELGIAKDFPAEPAMTKDVYKTPLARTAPEIVYSVVKDGITYRLAIVDFLTRPGDGANLMGEAAAQQVAGKDTTFTVDDFPLYDKGANSVYGAILRIQKKDGGRMNAVNFFNKGRLYMVQVVVPADAPDKGTPDISRFMDTVVFHLQGYGFNFDTGHDFPLGDDDPNDRDTHVNPNYKPPAGYSGSVPN
jgi:hypothetical protein